MLTYIVVPEAEPTTTKRSRSPSPSKSTHWDWPTPNTVSHSPPISASTLPGSQLRRSKWVAPSTDGCGLERFDMGRRRQPGPTTASAVRHVGGDSTLVSVVGAGGACLSTPTGRTQPGPFGPEDGTHVGGVKVGTSPSDADSVSGGRRRDAAVPIASGSSSRASDRIANQRGGLP